MLAQLSSAQGRYGSRSSFDYEQELKAIDCEVPDVVTFFDRSCVATNIIWCFFDEVTTEEFMYLIVEKFIS